MKLTDDVLQVLSACHYDGEVMVLPNQLERKLYERVNKVIVAAGGKWNRKIGGHVFPSDAEGIMEPILLTGEVVNEKKEFDAFYTPVTLAHRMALHAGIRPGTQKVLEPSCGTGRLVQAALDAGAELVAAYDIRDCKEMFDLALNNYARVNYFGGPSYNFPTQSPVDTFDVVLMNPPFSKSKEVAHVDHALKFVKPGGRLLSVMSAGITFREDGIYRKFRERLEAQCDHFTSIITRLPSDTFKESGTRVETVLLSVDRTTSAPAWKGVTG